MLLPNQSQARQSQVTDCPFVTPASDQRWRREASLAQSHLACRSL